MRGYFVLLIICSNLAGKTTLFIYFVLKNRVWTLKLQGVLLGSKDVN